MQPLREKGNLAEPSVKAQDTKGRWHSEGTGQLMHSSSSKQGRRSFTFLPPPRSWRRR
jgi:hypothetical protein